VKLKHTVCIVKYLGRLEIEHLLQLYLSFELSGWPKKQYRKAAALIPVRLSDWCTPGMGVILWGVSPLYMNPVAIKR
jgi:hypothetical protein